MVAYAKELGMPALAITDHGNMYGAIWFYQACKEAGIKPIIGCEIYVAKRSLRDKEAGVDKEYNHLVLLAENNQGYKNLMKIVSEAWLNGFYYKPRTDLALLEKYHEGLICLSACISGYVADPLTRNEDAEAEKRAKKLNEIFGQGNFYLEIQHHIDVPLLEEVNKKLVNMSKLLGIPLIATNDNHYTRKEDAEAQEILLCIQTQQTLLDKNRKLSMVSSPDFYLKSEEEMKKLFADTPDSIANAEKIANRCHVEITLGRWVMPKFSVPERYTTKEYLRRLVSERIEKRYNPVTDEVRKRVEYELDIIITKGYETYFLTVQDFVIWAKEHGISVGPGRGSSAGSVVAYILQITDVDPFFFKLSFERFLNPLRPSAPDIDLDFADTRRDEVIAYVTKKYGEDKVAQIITFGTMEARGAVRDVGRALGLPYAVPDRIAKMIPPGWQGHAMTIEQALQQSPDLKRAYDNEPDTKHLLNLSTHLEGVARHASVHAAGVVISDKPLTEYVPLQRETNGDRIVTQYDMYTVGEDGVGLLKMDFLGLRNLTIIEEALRFIKINQGKEIDISKLPLDDKKTYDLLSQAETTGIFQFESAGMRRYIKELKPTTIFDLQAMNALYRPGPMQNIPEFIRRKNNPKLITYPHPDLEDILKESYGVLTFQDDVLLTVIKLAGYTWLDADKFRKAMGKKIPAEMKKQEEMFVKGCVKNGILEKKAKELFTIIAPFAGYGFVKAHAACYALIAYRTAYLKAHYPAEFMTALLTAESRGTTGPAKSEKIAQAIAECKRLSVPVLPPDINTSLQDFSIENYTSVRFGLSAVKNVGTAAIESILYAKRSGQFQSLQDFCTRVNLSAVNKKTLESLIKAGAFDTFGNRASLLIAMPDVVAKANDMKKQVSDGQGSLFGTEDIFLLKDEVKKSQMKKIDEDIEDFTEAEKLAFEKEFLGFYLTAHPQMGNLQIILPHTTHEIELLEGEEDGNTVKVGGIIENVKKIYTKRSNAEMAFMTLGDEKGVGIECVVFPKIYEIYRNILVVDNVILVQGKINTRDDKLALIIDKILSIDAVLDLQKQRI